MSSQRERWSAAASLDAGLSAKDPAFRERIAPERLEGRGLSDSMIRMWCCGLYWCALAREMGLGTETGDPEVDHAYKIGNAVADVIAVFSRHGAWHATWSGVAKGAPMPDLGDCVIVGAGGYHVRGCIVAIDANYNVEIVEGGHQTSAGDMSIERVKARLFVLNGLLYCEAGAASDSGRVYGWGDVSRLPDPNATVAGDVTRDAAGPDTLPAGAPTDETE